MKKMKKAAVLLLCAVMVIASALPVMADTNPGDTVAVLGNDLTSDEKNQMLTQFGATDETTVLYVNIDDEHAALDGVVPAEEIGNVSISSVMITFTSPGSGLNIQMSHINYITPQSYANALTTLGITDADIQISAPYDVSGTAALTGIMKGFEEASGSTIDQDTQQAANEEALVTTDLTNSLADQVGSDQAAVTVNNIINDIKIEINNQNPQSDEEIEGIVREVLEKYNVTLSDEDYQKLVALFEKLRSLNIDWGKVSDIIESNGNNLLQQLEDAAGDENTRSFFSQIGDWFRQLWDTIRSWFS